MKIVGINFASQYISMMIKNTDDWAKQLPIGEEIDLSFETSKLTFNIISKILFGRDIDKAANVQYVYPDSGEVKSLSLAEYFIQYVKDELDAYVRPKGHIFPFLMTYKLAEPYKSNSINHNTLYAAIKEFLSTSKDDQSVYKQIMSQNNFKFDDILYDMMIMLLGGYDTISHLIASILY